MCTFAYVHHWLCKHAICRFLIIRIFWIAQIGIPWGIFLCLCFLVYWTLLCKNDFYDGINWPIRRKLSFTVSQRRVIFLGADVLRRVKTFFLNLLRRWETRPSGKLAKMAFAGQENSKKRHKDISLRGMYVVVQFYPWYKLHFPLFHTHYHTLP